MAYPIFPLDKLPYPVRDNFTQKYGVPFTRTQMDDSHGRLRRLFRALPVSNTITWYMTWEQLEWFEAFLRYDCAQASGFFTMPLNPVSQPTTFRFTAYPDIAFDGSLGRWVVTGAVESVRGAPTDSGTGRTALPTFPAGLPEPEQSNYTIKRQDSFSRSNLAQGLATQRARFKDEVALVTYEWDLDSDEYAIFDDFIQNKLFGGLAPFIGPFANGSGATNLRIQFVDSPQVTTNLSGYTISATAEVRDIPMISEFKYRGLGQLNLSDTITFQDEVFAELGTFARDVFGYAEQVTFKIGKAPTDQIMYSEQIAIKLEMNRAITDNITYSEMLSFNIKLAPIQEFFVIKTTGSSCFEDYAHDWCQFTYVAKCFDFSPEEAVNESLSYTENVVIGFSGNRSFNETMPMTAIGNLTMDIYSTDYVEFGYTGDAVRTF